MQIGQLLLQQLMNVGVARDVAGAAAAGAEGSHCVDHRVDHGRVLPHTEIVIRAPHRHLIPDAVMVSSRETTAAPFEISEDAVASFATKLA
jgi:hypothetical protein